MSKIVIVGIGTRGDVAPLTGIGIRLQAAGHDVVIAAHEPYAELIENCGLRFRLLELNFGFEGSYAEVQRQHVEAFNTPDGFRVIGEGVITALLAESADLLLLTPWAEFAGHPFAEAYEIPTIGVRFQPLSATADHPPSVMGVWSAGATGNRWAADLGAWVVDRRYRAVVGDFRRELGLHKVPVRELRRNRTAAQWPILHGYSPLVAPRPADWRPGLDVAGFWWPARPTDWKPPANLVEFLEAGPAPVFVGFGSNMNNEKRAAELSTTVRTALRRAGIRGIVQAGWTVLDVADENVMNVGEIPYDWLFPRVAAAVHHSGAGTCAAALRAGVPTIAVPQSPEQRFWAHRFELLGVTAGTVRQPDLTTEWLTDAIARAATDSRLRANIARVAMRLDEEDGEGVVLRTVEAVLERSATV
ncbi:glycosyltransferase family 1 protein [Nocardia uniformis]|uniref:Glycosyltransferase family 1 protein n=1 Tax=Nocardia uniformis TaxID=53432 RepID=A0A849C0X5_9NOCA|nr:glycosyltransferase [Nocardia uniformis]NNH69995.1 glycosyltransferase family 1 protein [Nocardia uniformis]